MLKNSYLMHFSLHIKIIVINRYDSYIHIINKQKNCISANWFEH